MPKVSVIIPTCNRPDLLPKAIKSVLDQTYQDFEIIIVDDGQKKSAEDVVRQLNDGRIKYIKHDEGKGGAAARNTGIKTSRGQFIAFLDDDDSWLTEKLEKQVGILESCDDLVVMVFCGFYKYNKAGQLLDVRLPDQSGIIWPLDQVLNRSYIWTSTIMVRKKAIEKGILFDEKLKKNQEWDFQLQLLKIGKFYAINEPLAELNILGEEEHMGGRANIDNIISALELFVQKHYSDYKKQKKSLALQYFQLADLYCYKSNYQKVRTMLIRSWLNSPFNMIYLTHLLVLLLSFSLYRYLKSKSNTRFFR